MGSLLPQKKSAHVIVFGNEKGGTGKSTTAVNVIVALLKAGHTVASIDTDSRQLSLTRYLENRSRWARTHGIALEVPTHFSVRLGEGDVASEVEADPLVTPVNDSLVDLDVLGRIDGETLTVRAISHYAELVREARRNRLAAHQPDTDWIVVGNRISTLASRNQRKVVDALKELSALLGFRIADGISERVVFREFFPSGVTALDTLDRAVLGIRPTMSHLTARREIRELVDSLRLAAPGASSAPVSAVALEGLFASG